MSTETFNAVLTSEEADLARIAQRSIMTALDQSHAHRIALFDQSGSGLTPVLDLPPQALRFFADLLGAMSEQKLISVTPVTRELTTQEAARFLNVSRPFVIKEIEAGRLSCRKVGRHRRIDFSDLARYQRTSRAAGAQALQDLADLDRVLGLG